MNIYDAKWAGHLEKVTNSENRQQWLQDRRRFVGASEVAALMGDNPWRSILDVWHEKVTGESEFSGNFRTRIGSRVEPIVLDLAAEWLGEKTEHGWVVENNRDTVRDPKLPGLAVTVDGMAWPAGVAGEDEPPLLIEAKATSEQNEKEWLTAGIPRYYWWQCQAQMLVFRRSHMYLAALFGMLRFEMFKVDADTDAQRRLAERAARFMTDVERTRESGDIEPPEWMREVADAEGRRRYVLEHGEYSEDTACALTEEADRLIADIELAKRAKKAAENRIKAAEARLAEMLAEREAAVGVTPAGGSVRVRTVRLPERTLKATEFKRMYIKAKK